MLECSSSNSCKETRIKIILKIYTTAEKVNKINSVAALDCLEQKKKTQLFCADITDVRGMGLVTAMWIKEQIHWMHQAQGNNSGLLPRLAKQPRQIF